MATEEEYVLDLNKMKIADLKRELKIRNLPVSGNKQELILRLEQYLEEHEGAEVEDDDAILEEEEDEVKNVDPEPVVEEKPEKIEVKDKKETDPVEKIEEVVVEPTHVTSQPLKNMTDEEKRDARAKKFGLKTSDLSDIDRLSNRSKRFGTGGAGGQESGKISSEAINPEKLKSRAERFGTVVSDVLVKSELDEKKRKREERFAGSEMTDIKKKRAERFGIVV